MSELLTATELRNLVGKWIADGKRVAGPRCVKADNGPRHNNIFQYTWLDSADQLTLDGFIRPANSVKEFVFPRHEVLYGYTLKGKRIEMTPPNLPTAEQIVVGARPCDAAALAILDGIFNWDYKDEFYNRRRELTTVITLACSKHDEFCFCTSLGTSPSDTRGSDIVLVELGNEKYEVRCLTEKGQKLLAGATTASSEEGQISQGPPVHFDLDAIGKFLAAGYEQPEWQDATRRCLGCGACAYTCPTCHCFDIVDEGTASGGVRARNWDACQFPMFTLHASGHNPRNAQGERQRQRIHHKFQIYPEKFGELLCTGCGNCARNCPVNMGVLPVLIKIAAQGGASNPSETSNP